MHHSIFRRTHKRNPASFRAMLLLLGLLLLASDAGAKETKPAPMPAVRVSRFVKPPTLDGKGDDAMWAKTVGIRDFVVFGSHQPVQQDGTEVRFGYDDDFLYVLAHCEESLLVTASQRQLEIKANAKARDEEVLKDDSIFLLLKPPGSKDAFEFAVNTLGIVADAKTSQDRLWADRDTRWNAGVKVAVTVSDGYWSVEMAIPWRDIAARAPVSGEHWQVVLARLARGRNEQSSWNLTSAPGAHAPEGFGELIFGTSELGLQPARPFSFLEAGKNVLDVELAANESSSGLVISTEVATPGNEGSTHRARTKATAGTTPVKVEHAFEVGEVSAVSFNWSAYDAATLELVYRSPQQLIPVQTSHLVLKVTTAKSYQLFLNDQLLAKGEKADAAQVRVPLRTGVNLLALQAESGTASLELESPAMGAQPLRWKMAKANTPGATSTGSDDASWETAPASNTAAGIPPEIGKAGEPIILRHTILLRQTRTWPLPHPALHIAGNSTQQAIFLAAGIPGRELRDWKVFFEMPTALEAIGSTGFNGNRDKDHLKTPGKPRFTLQTIEGSDTAAEKRHYHVAADEPIRFQSNQKPILSLFELMLRPAPDAPLTPKSAPLKLTYWSTANDGTVSELKQEIPVQLLPPLKGRQPKKIVWQLWGAWLGIMDDDAMRDALLSTASAAGFTEVDATGRRTVEQAQAHGLGIQAQTSFKPWNLNASDYCKEHPQARLINSKQQPESDSMCTSALLDEGWAPFAPQLKSQLETLKPKALRYDYEFDPLVGPHSCYCERCLAAFRAAASLGSEVALTPQKIRQEYAPQWVDFMARRVARIFLQMKKTIHEAAPDVSFRVYSGYQSPDNPSRYGVDWRYVGEWNAVDLASCGYGRSAAVIDATTHALSGIPALFGELLTPYMVPGRINADIPSVQVNKATFLRRSLDATGGVLVYDRQTMDGRTWYAVAETTRLVAEHEDLFLAHQLESIPGQDPESIQLLRGKEGSLLCVMNLRSKEQKFSFKIPENIESGEEYYGKRAVKPGENVQLTLPPGETAVYVLK